MHIHTWRIPKSSSLAIKLFHMLHDARSFCQSKCLWWSVCKHGGLPTSLQNCSMADGYSSCTCAVNRVDSGHSRFPAIQDKCLDIQYCGTFLLPLTDAEQSTLTYSTLCIAERSPGKDANRMLGLFTVNCHVWDQDACSKHISQTILFSKYAYDFVWDPPELLVHVFMKHLVPQSIVWWSIVCVCNSFVLSNQQLIMLLRSCPRCKDVHLWTCRRDA